MEYNVYSICETPEEVLIDFFDKETVKREGFNSILLFDGDPDFLLWKGKSIPFVEHQGTVIYGSEYDKDIEKYLLSFVRFLYWQNVVFTTLPIDDNNYNYWGWGRACREAQNYKRVVKYRGGSGYTYVFYAKKRDKIK